MKFKELNDHCMNLTSFNIKADIRDSIFLEAMVIQDTSCEFVTFL
jgi:hypothetical protein